jgi:uncharacterized membrane protein YczE
MVVTLGGGPPRASTVPPSAAYRSWTSVEFAERQQAAIMPGITAGRGEFGPSVSTAREIPATPWSSTGTRWSLHPRSVLVLVAGLWVFATGEAMFVAATLGNSPWTALADGISRHTPLTIGGATFAISVLVMVAWIPLRERIGLGTVLNAVVIALGLDVMLRILPRPETLVLQLAMVTLGVGVLAVGAAVYLTANLGPGPRDGVMTGLHRRFGWRIAPVRTGIEVGALSLGWLLGGRVGIGTAIFALGVGPALALVLLRLRRRYPAVVEAAE